jgi:hypothetical protein
MLFVRKIYMVRRRRNNHGFAIVIRHYRVLRQLILALYSCFSLLRARLSTPFNGHPPIYDGLFKKNLRDTSLNLNYIAMALLFLFASSCMVLFEFGSFQWSIEVPSTCPLCLVSEKPDYRAVRCTTEITQGCCRPTEHRRFE